MRHLKSPALALAALVGLSLPAAALDLQNTQLSNITIGAGAGNLGRPGLNNSASISGSRLEANTNVVNKADLGLTPLANAQVVGVVQTTRLEAGGGSTAVNGLTANGTLSGSYNNVQQSGNLNPNGNLNGTQSQLQASGTLTGQLNNTSSSFAGTGLSGYSGSSLTGTGSLQGHVDGGAIAIGAGLSGGAGLSSAAR